MFRKKYGWWFVIFFLLMGSRPAMASGGSQYEIRINLPAYTLTVYANGALHKSYPIAIGKPGNETPIGDFAIVRKVKNPVWYPPRGGSPVPSGPSNPLGYRWLEYKTPGYGIHGNSNPASIGHAVSLGCIRMRNRDVEELYEYLPVGTPVRIGYETLEVTADTATRSVQLRVYPDIYRKGTSTPERLRQKLAAVGCSVTEAELPLLLQQGLATAVTVSPPVEVELAGTVLAETAFWQDGLLLLPLKAMAEATGRTVVWDGRRNAPSLGGEEVSCFYRGGKSFVSLEQAEILLSLRGQWQPEAGRVTLNWDAPETGQGE